MGRPNSKERDLLADIDDKNKKNVATWSEWYAFLLARIAQALAQIVDRMDTLSEALDSFRPRWIDNEVPEMDKKQREKLERAGVIYPAGKPIRPKAKNVYYEENDHCEFKCSVCGATIGVVEGGTLDGANFKYCPWCGAELDGEVREWDD